MTFLSRPSGEEAERLREADRAGYGFTMNLTELWAHDPGAKDAFFDLAAGLCETAGLDLRDRGVLTAATAATHSDSYCAIAWGGKLAAAADEEVALAVLRGDDDALTPRDRALAGWARRVAGDPSATTAADLQPLREVGLDDRAIFALTTYIGLRLAFSTVNAALGASPDADLRRLASEAVVDAVTWGRPIEP